MASPSRDRTAPAPDVALFMPTLIGGGAERVQLILAAYLRSQGLRVDLVVCKNVGALKDSVPPGVRLVSLDARRVLLSSVRYRRYLRQARPKVVLSSVENASVVACVARAFGSPPHRLVVRQDNALATSERLWGQPRRWLWLAALALSYRFADRVVAVSRGVEAQLLGLLGRAARVELIHNPIAMPEPDGLLADAASGSPEPDRGRLIVAAGRLHPVKDYPTLLRAFAVVLRDTEAELVVMGEGGERPALEALGRELGISARVSFAGFVAAPAAIMRRARVFALSSLSEGFPTVLIEALAAGASVVSTDCRHGPREILEAAGCGTLVPVGDVEALAAALRDALNSPPPPRTPELSAYLDRFRPERAGRAYLRLLEGDRSRPD